MAHVASISNDGIDTTVTTVDAVDVWGGPLSGGAYVFGLANRHATASPVEARWSMLEVEGMGDGTSACVRELFTNTTIGTRVGGVTATVAAHGLAVMRVVPGEQC